MDALSKKAVKKCHLCPDLGKNHCPSSGTVTAELMIVGASPGETEVKKGEPFVGDCGELVELLLAEIYLDRTDVYIANTLKCRPHGNRKGTKEEIATCWNTWLRHEVREVDPRVVLLLGKDAWSVGPAKSPSCSLVETRGPKTIIYYYHPSFYLRRGDVHGFLKVAELVKNALEGENDG